MSSEQTSATGNPPPSDVEVRLAKVEAELKTVRTKSDVGLELLGREVKDLRQALLEIAREVRSRGGSADEVDG